MSNDTDQLRLVDRAATRFAMALSTAMPDDLAAKMTCYEAECTADLYRQLYFDDLAAQIIRAHATSDNEEDDLHHDLFLSQQ